MMILEPLLKGLGFVVLGLLEMMGWKRAGKWLDQIMGDARKSEKPVA